MTIFAYLRVSTEEQTVENQRLKIESAGFAVDEWYEDEGVSGTKSAFERKAFKQLLSVVKAGDTIIAVEVSRLGRSTVDVLNLIEHLKNIGVKLRIMNLDAIDLTSPTGRLMLTLMASCAQFERELLVERTKAGLDRAKANGKQLGKPLKHTPEQLETMFEQLSSGVKMCDVAFRNNVSERQLARYKAVWSCTNKKQEYVNKFVSQQKQLKGNV